MPRWNVFKIASTMPTEEEAKRWAIEEGLVKTTRWCDRHATLSPISPGPLFGISGCRGKVKGRPYDHQAVVALNTWLENLHCDVRQRIIITYAFANAFSFQQTINEASIQQSTVSRETVIDVFSYCREVCMAWLDATYHGEGKIGGDGCIVKIDECKIGKRKYNRGRMVEGHWIIGMMERGGSGYRLEICQDNCRSADTLIPLIQKHVAEGTEIHTDLWKGYLNLSNFGYTHLTVNHSQHFVGLDTGAYTQNIVSSWRSKKRRLSKGGIEDNLYLHLCELLW